MSNVSLILYVLIAWAVLLAIFVTFVVLAGRRRARRSSSLSGDPRLGPPNRRAGLPDRRIGMPDTRSVRSERRRRSGDRRVRPRDRRRSGAATA